MALLHVAQKIDAACGFIFDCDGTLLDTLDAWDKAEAPLFAKAGNLTSAQEDEIHAAPFDEAMRILHENYKVGKSAQENADYLDSVLLPYYRFEAKLLPGVAAFVKARAQAGIPCLVVSSSPQRYLRAGLEAAGLLDYFCGIISTEDEGLSKQDERIYLSACNYLQCAPKDVWAVDDAPYALEVMARVGINTIGVGNACSKEREEELKRAASLYTPSLEDLIELAR